MAHHDLAIVQPSIKHDHQPAGRKFKMNIISTRNVIAAATVAVIAGLAFTAPTASAATYDNLNKCHFATKERVIKCCETIIRKKGKPWWFVETNSNCNTAAVCRRKVTVTHVSKPRCYVQVKFPEAKGAKPELAPPAGGQPNNIAGGKV
jgi:hypothetical protein